MKVFQCKGCGMTDSIVEITLIPSIQHVSLKQDAIDKNWFLDVAYGWFKNFDEADTELGYGCENEDCEFWQGEYGRVIGNRHDDPNGGRFEWAPRSIEDVAEIIEEEA